MDFSTNAGTAVLDRPPAKAGIPGPSANHGTAFDSKSVRWRVITDRAELTGLSRQWSQLADTRAGSLFMTPEWIEAWITTIGRDVQPRVLTGWAPRQRLVAIWPLCVRQAGGGLTRRSVLEPMGEMSASGDRLDPLTSEARLESELIDQVRSLADENVDLIHWGELSAGCRLTDQLLNESTDSALQTIRTRVLPWTDLPPTYDEFTARLSKKLRGHVRRQEQLAKQQHGLTWRLNDEETSLESAVQAFADLHQQCWQYRGHNGNLTESRFRAFIDRFAHAAHQRGWLRLHRLCDGDRTVAALLAFHHGRRACYYQSGWDPAIAELSPGSLCVARAIRTAIEENLSVFDFLRGDEPYKRRWVDRQDETVTVAEAVTRKGRVLLSARDAKEWLKHTIQTVGGAGAWEGLKNHLRFCGAATAR